jgi:Na+/H+ antiporter NhaC
MFTFLMIVMRRDFGPMLKAEQRARRTGEVLRPGSTPLVGKELEDLKINDAHPKHWYNAVIPILVLLFTIVGGMYIDGKNALGTDNIGAASLRDIFGSADPYRILIWGSITSSITAICLTVWQKISNLHDTIETWVSGVKSRVLAVIVLSFAWSLAGVMGESARNTKDTIAQLVGQNLRPQFLPMITFLLAWLVAFATGTSWGTMAVVFPLIFPLTQGIAQAAGMDPASFAMLLSAVSGAVLTGAICGDHSSPVSDTTIMSSMWSAVDHMDHVRTQLPYAITVGVISVFFGYLPAGFGLSPWISLCLGAVAIFALLRFFGRDPEASATS